MSLLGNNHTVSVAAEQKAAAQIKNSASQLGKQIVRQWEHGFDTLWNNPRATPAQILAELGTDAGEVFDLSEATVTYMLSVLATDGGEWATETIARIQAKAASKPATTTQKDGSVTLD